MFFNILKHTLKNIVRNKFLTFSSVLVIGLLMFFINILIILHEVSLKVIDNINDKISINLYLKKDVDKTSKEFRDFRRDIKNLSSKINIWYTAKENILEKYKKEEIELVKIIKWVENPFPNTILLSNINIDSYEKINKIIEPRIKWENAIFDVNINKLKKTADSYKERFKAIKKISLTLQSLKFWLYFFILIFVLSIFIIIYSIIWNFIFHYRNEIYITKLIGWSKRFIYGPFTFQWMIYAFLAFAISSIWFYFFIKYLPSIFEDFDIVLNFDITTLYGTFEKIMFIELAVFVFIGALSWLLSSRKYSKEIKY